jgi:hypothetical protein
MHSRRLQSKLLCKHPQPSHLAPGGSAATSRCGRMTSSSAGSYSNSPPFPEGSVSTLEHNQYSHPLGLHRKLYRHGSHVIKETVVVFVARCQAWSTDPCWITQCPSGVASSITVSSRWNCLWMGKKKRSSGNWEGAVVAKSRREDTPVKSYEFLVAQTGKRPVTSACSEGSSSPCMLYERPFPKRRRPRRGETASRMNGQPRRGEREEMVGAPVV